MHGVTLVKASATEGYAQEFARLLPMNNPPTPFGVYVHTPYCIKKCPYCDFYTRPAEASEADRYVQALIREILAFETFGWEKGRPLTSIFLGGGTPSLLHLENLKAILETIGNTFSINPDTEITLEINPDTVTLEKAKGWKAMGINRTSLGVQSLNDVELTRLGREHDADGARKAFRILREAGFTNMSVDLMNGLEGQTLEGWNQTLDEVLTWKPEHISVYQLTVEERTPFATEVKKGALRLPTDDLASQLFQETRTRLLHAGLVPYEISNFARNDLKSKHNMLYWTGADYWGVGVSAHSFRRTDKIIRRWWNVRDENRYVTAALEGQVTNAQEFEELSPRTHLGELLMTGLRLAEGMNVSETAAALGLAVPEPIYKGLQRFESMGFIRQSSGKSSLTEEGLLVSNEIFREFLA